jgi:hypothetical protein
MTRKITTLGELILFSSTSFASSTETVRLHSHLLNSRLRKSFRLPDPAPPGSGSSSPSPFAPGFSSFSSLFPVSKAPASTSWSSSFGTTNRRTSPTFPQSRSPMTFRFVRHALIRQHHNGPSATADSSIIGRGLFLFPRPPKPFRINPPHQTLPRTGARLAGGSTAFARVASAKEHPSKSLLPLNKYLQYFLRPFNLLPFFPLMLTHTRQIPPRQRG